MLCPSTIRVASRAMESPHTFDTMGTVRDAVLMNEYDIRALGLHAGARVRLSNDVGVLEGHLVPAPVTKGSGACE